MKLVIGLGNPGKKYESTRHNAGFIFVDLFAEKNNFDEWKFESRFKADICEGKYHGEKVLLLKPQTFMNLSGESIQKVCAFFKISEDNFIVIYDDKDMDFGKTRFRNTGSAGGHNGIKSIIQYFGKDFKRVKIGVGYDSHYDVSDWVLGNFNEEELIDLDNEVFEKTLSLLDENI